MEGKRGSECLLKSVSNIDFNPNCLLDGAQFKVNATVKLSAKESRLVKYGMTGKTITVIGKKTYFNYYKDKLLHKLQN